VHTDKKFEDQAMVESTLRTALLCKRREILDRISQLSGHVGARAEPYSSDADERAIELENLDVLFEIDSASRLELGQINHALERMDDGTYGRCRRCGQPIDPLRQQALPYTDTCMACAT
jgi:DnaK suppressor protein